MEPKIFIIGFNRCGTRTLHHFFKDNGLGAIHWDCDNLVNTFEKNIKRNKKLLDGGRTVKPSVSTEGLYSKCIVFSDMTRHDDNKDAKDYYKRLDQDYPGSKFILNIRNVDDWIASRKKHCNGLIVNKLKKYHNCSLNELENKWKEMFNEHTNQVLEYFKDRPDDLLVFDINTNTVDDVVNFFEPYYNLDKSKWHINR